MTTKVTPAQATAKWRKKNKMSNKDAGYRKNLHPAEKEYLDGIKRIS